MNIGFIGMGMVARAFAEAIAASGNRVRGYDAGYRGREREFSDRFAGLPVTFTDSLETLISDCDLLLSTVTTDVAVAVAARAAPALRPGQWYVDMNSTSPERKVEIARVLSGKVRFVEAAILGAVGATGAQTQILLSGPRAGEAAGLLTACGLRASPFGEQIGRASLFKMIRSVFSKGLETLVIEMMTAGELAGIREEVWRDILDFLSQQPFDAICDNWVVTHPRAAARRGFEMEQAARTIEALGLTPHMSMASLRVFEHSAGIGLSRRFPQPPKSADEVIRALAADAASRSGGPAPRPIP